MFNNKVNKMVYMRFILLVSFCLFLCGALLASQRKDSLDFIVYFKVGKADIEPDFCGNSRTLDKMIFEINRLQHDGMLHKLHFMSSTSPEGGVELNSRLSQKRLWQLHRYISSQADISNSLCELSSIGIDWCRLSNLVNNSDVGYKRQVNELMEIHSHYKERCASLMNVANGYAWKDMTRLFFPSLRAGRLVIFFYTSDADSLASQKVPIPRLVVPEANLDIRMVRYPDAGLSFPEKKRRFFMAIKSNLLYDAALIPNVAVEFSLKDNWTLGAGWMHAWWKNDRHNRYWRIYGAEFDVRKYFGKVVSGRPFSGHHLGAFVQFLTWDFELGKRGYMCGKPGGDIWDKAGKGVGIAYGYSLPVSSRLNLDFGIGAGVFMGTCYKYVPSGDKYIWNETRKLCWIGPTKLEVALVWIIGKGSFIKKK